LQREPIYEMLAHQDGIHLPTAASRSGLALRRISQVLRAATEVLDAKMRPLDALDGVKTSALQTWPITNERGMIGVIGRGQLRRFANDGGAVEKALHELIDLQEFPHLHADHSLDTALERMGASQLDLLPVVSRANVNQLEGVVMLTDVLALYGLA